MPYTPTTWVEGVTKLGPTNMNHLETGVSGATTTADGAIAKPASPASNDGLVWNGSTWTNAKLVDANIAAGAAIVYSKLSLAGGIVNNDISSSAAIASSKIAGLATVTRGLYSSGPPGSPADGDIWVAVDSLTVPTFAWYFRFATGATTLKWEFIGGSDAYVTVATDESTASTTFVALTTAGPSFVLSRQGDYDIFLQCETYGTDATTPAMGYDLGATTATRAKAAMIGLSAATPGANETAAMTSVFRETGVAASTTITAKYLAHDGGAFTNHFLNRVLRVRPVRVI